MPRSLSIMPSRMRLAEYDVQNWVANTEFGTTEEDLLKPDFWAHVASQLKPYDHIEARAEDGSWVIHLVVMGCDRTWARVAIDRKIFLTVKDVAETQASIQDLHEVQWKGPQHRWAVIRKSDSAMVNKGFATKEEAAFWKHEHENQVVTPAA